MSDTHATDDEIENAIFEALRGTLSSAPTPGPFHFVDRYAGEVTQDQALDQATLGRSPSALLAYEGARTEGPDGAQSETGGHEPQVVEQHMFRVYVTVRDQRGDGAAMKGTVGQPGALRCARAVKQALVGLRIPGLFDGDVVRLIETRPWLIARGTAYSLLVRVMARAAIEPSVADGAPEPRAGVPLRGLRGDLPDPQPDTDGAPVVRSHFQTILD